MQIRLAVIVAALFVAAGFVSQSVAQPRPPSSVNYQVDFSDLDEYGEWYKLPKIGWVWVPYADSDWRPFVYGRWVWTADGWMWDSYEPFGWIVCHYGHWYWDDEMGWAWVPGYEWSPARVEWVVTDYDIAWAPLPPPGHVLPPAFTVSADRVWNVVPYARFTDDNVYEFRIVGPRPGPVARKIIRRTAPPIGFIKKAVGRPVAVVKVEKSVQVKGQHRFVKPRMVTPPGRPIPAVPVGVKYKRTIDREGPAVGPREGYVEQGPAEGRVQEPVVKGREVRPGHAAPGPGPGVRVEATVSVERGGPGPGPRPGVAPRDNPPGPQKQLDGPGNSATAPGHNKGGPGPGPGPGNSDNAPGHSKSKGGPGPGNSDNAPGHNKGGPGPGNSDSAPGHNKAQAKPNDQSDDDNDAGKTNNAPAKEPKKGGPKQ